MSYESPTIAELAARSLEQPHQTVHAIAWPMKHTAGVVTPRPRSETQEPPCCLFQRPPKHTVHAVIPMDSREVEWLNLRPITQYKSQIREPGKPLGTLEGLDAFLNRVARIQELATQQERDAATARTLIEQEKPDALITQELMTLGQQLVKASSEYDDDIAAANYAARNLRVVPYSPDPEELLLLTQQIEWEKARAKNGPILTVALVEGADNSFSAIAPQPWMAKMLGIEGIRDLGRKLRDACGYANFNELDDARARSAYYGIASRPTAEEREASIFPEQSMDMLGMEDYGDKCMITEDHATCTEKKGHCRRCHKDHTPSRGEQELLLHGDMNGYVTSSLPWGDQIHLKGDTPHGTPLLGFASGPIEDTTEPSEFALWGTTND